MRRHRHYSEQALLDLVIHGSTVLVALENEHGKCHLWVQLCLHLLLPSLPPSIVSIDLEESRLAALVLEGVCSLRESCLESLGLPL